MVQTGPADDWPTDTLRRMHRIYRLFTSGLALDPTVEKVVEVIGALAPGPIAITDTFGTVTHANYPFHPGLRIEPPAVRLALDVPRRIGSSWCATPVSAPRSAYIWIESHDADDPLVVMSLLDIAAERIHFLAAQSLHQGDERRALASRFVRLLLDGQLTEPVRTLACELDHDLDRSHHVIVIDPPQHSAPIGFMTEVDDIVGEHARVALVEDRVVMVVDRVDSLHEIVRGLEGLHERIPIRGGVSGVSVDGSDLGRYLEQALIALHVGNGHTALSWFEECDLLSLLAHHADGTTIDERVADTLAPVLTYAGPQRNEFLDTLRQWLDTSDSLDALAERLQIHRSTLTYRRKRLNDLLGDDLHDPDRRFELALALRLRERRPAPP